MSLLERHRNIIDFALSSLGRRWKKNIALTLVYAFTVFTLASVIFFTEAAKREAKAVLQGAPHIVVQGSWARHDLIPEAYIDTLKKITGGLVIGAVITSPPPNPQPIVIQNTTYIVSEGVYYQQQGTGYVVVNPPIGVTVQAVPPGATQVTVNGQVYFLANGIHYQPVMQNGVTVYSTVKL